MKTLIKPRSLRRQLGFVSTLAIAAAVASPLLAVAAERGAADGSAVDREFASNVCETDNLTSPYCSQFPTQVVGPEIFGVYTIPTLTAQGHKVTQAIIEFVSGSCGADTRDDIVSVSLNTAGPTGTQYFLLPARTASRGGTSSNWVFSQMTKIYASPGATIALGVDSANPFAGLQSCNAQFSGTLLTD